MAQLPPPQDLRIELRCTNCSYSEMKQAPAENQHVLIDEAVNLQKWHEAQNSHRVNWVKSYRPARTTTIPPQTDPETLDELQEATALTSRAARIQILKLPLEQGGDLGDETRSRFTVIVDRAPAHLADNQDFQDAMKDFARDSGAETAFVTSETIEIAEL